MSEKDQVENLERQIASLKKDMKMLGKVDELRKRLHMSNESTIPEIFAELDKVIEQGKASLILIESNKKL